MKIASISSVQPKLNMAEKKFNKNGVNANNLTFGHHSAPRGKISGWTAIGTFVGGAAAAILTGGASLIVQSVVMTAGVIGGAVAGEAVNDKLNGKK